MIAPNSVHFRNEPQRSGIDALVSRLAKNGPTGWWLTRVGQQAAEEAEQDRVDVEQAGDDHQREEARDDEVLHRVHAEHLQRVELLADLARAEVGGDRRAGHAGDARSRSTNGANSRIERQHEEAAEAVVGAEQREEVGGLQARRRVAERDRRDHQREPAQPQREQELLDELAAVGVGRLEGGHDRLPREDHHVAHFLQQALGRKECAIGDVANQSLSSILRTPPGGPTLRLTGNRREGYATALTWLKREPSPLLAQTRPASRRRPAARAPGCGRIMTPPPRIRGCGERPGGRVVGGRGDLDPVERERGERPVDEQRDGRCARRRGRAPPGTSQ